MRSVIFFFSPHVYFILIYTCIIYTQVRSARHPTALLLRHHIQDPLPRTTRARVRRGIARGLQGRRRYTQTHLRPRLRPAVSALPLQARVRVSADAEPYQCAAHGGR